MERAYEIVDGRYEPKVGKNIAAAIMEAIEDIQPNSTASFGLDAERCVVFSGSDRPRDVWDRLMEKIRA